MRVRRVLRTALATISLMGALAVPTIVSSTPASAVSAPYLHNSHGNHVWTSLTANYNTNIYRVEVNGTPFVMRCYKDGVWFYGSYWTNRWFYGKVFTYSGNFYYAWVSASWVANQSSVPHC